MTVIGPVGSFADALSGVLAQAVVDKTGLKGSYDVPLSWTPGPDQKESIAEALQEQLGLRLEPQKAPVQMLVIDDVEAASTS